MTPFDSPFGLGGSVFTSDPKHGAEVARKISTGMVFVNHPTMIKADLPFGGVRRSGYGRRNRLLEFLRSALALPKPKKRTAETHLPSIIRWATT